MVTDPRELHRWHSGHNYRVLSDGTFQGKSPGDPEDRWQTLDRWQSPTMGREIGRLAGKLEALTLPVGNVSLARLYLLAVEVAIWISCIDNALPDEEDNSEVRRLLAELGLDTDDITGLEERRHALVHAEPDPHCVICGLAKMAEEGRR